MLKTSASSLELKYPETAYFTKREATVGCVMHSGDCSTSVWLKSELPQALEKYRFLPLRNPSSKIPSLYEEKGLEACFHDLQGSQTAGLGPCLRRDQGFNPLGRLIFQSNGREGPPLRSQRPLRFDDHCGLLHTHADFSTQSQGYADLGCNP